MTEVHLVSVSDCRAGLRGWAILLPVCLLGAPSLARGGDSLVPGALRVDATFEHLGALDLAEYVLSQ